MSLYSFATPHPALICLSTPTLALSTTIPYSCLSDPYPLTSSRYWIPPFLHPMVPALLLPTYGLWVLGWNGTRTRDKQWKWAGEGKRLQGEGRWCWGQERQRLCGEAAGKEELGVMQQLQLSASILLCPRIQDEGLFPPV